MNFALAREVYGIGTWSIDSKSLPAMLQILANSKNGQTLELPEVKYNSISVLKFKSSSEDDVEDYVEEEYEPTNEDVQGIAIINLNGVITVDGGMSSYGMTDLSEMMLSLSKNDNIKGFIVYANSGGGSTSAVEIMTDAIAEVRKTKPVYGLVKKGGMACSACYAILASCEEIHCENDMAIVGSCGTMVQFEGRAANTEDGEGEKYIRLYASKSTKKNEEFEEALNNNNFKVITDNLLNPINERYLNLIETNRPILKGTDFDDGHTEFAKDSVGKFVDGISSKADVIKKVINKTRTNNTNINQNSNSKMTRTELNQAHPELVESIIQEGVTAERERVASWEAYREADSKAVSEGIASGQEITASQSHAFLVLLANKGKVNALKLDNAAPITTPESTTVENAGGINKEAEAAFDFKL
jgi:ClpP class serine protease